MLCRLHWKPSHYYKASNNNNRITVCIGQLIYNLPFDINLQASNESHVKSAEMSGDSKSVDESLVMDQDSALQPENAKK